MPPCCFDDVISLIFHFLMTLLLMLPRFYLLSPSLCFAYFATLSPIAFCR